MAADPTITPDVERALRALDERCRDAFFTLNGEALRVDHPNVSLHIYGKAHGVALARSYIADALRSVP